MLSVSKARSQRNCMSRRQVNVLYFSASPLNGRLPVTALFQPSHATIFHKGRFVYGRKTSIYNHVPFVATSPFHPSLRTAIKSARLDHIHTSLFCHCYIFCIILDQDLRKSSDVSRCDVLRRKRVLQLFACLLRLLSPSIGSRLGALECTSSSIAVSNICLDVMALPKNYLLFPKLGCDTLFDSECCRLLADILMEHLYKI